MSWVYWSLSTELAFYAVMSVLIFAGAERARTLALAHVVLCAAACWPGWSRVPGLFFIELWPLFGAGAALTLWKTKRGLAVAMLAAAALHAVACVAQGRLIAYWLAAAGGIVACAWALHGGARIWPRALTGAGEMSYSLYLLHMPIGVYVLGRLVPTLGTAPLLEITRQILLVLLTLVVIRPFYLWLERPFVRPSPRPLSPALEGAAP